MIHPRENRLQFRAHLILGLSLDPVLTYSLFICPHRSSCSSVHKHSLFSIAAALVLSPVSCLHYFIGGDKTDFPFSVIFLLSSILSTSTQPRFCMSRKWPFPNKTQLYYYSTLIPDGWHTFWFGFSLFVWLNHSIIVSRVSPYHF